VDGTGQRAGGRCRPAVSLLVAGVSLLSAACGGTPAPDPAALVQGALAQQYFDEHRALPDDRTEAQLAKVAQGLLERVYALPAPPPGPGPIAVDVRKIREARGSSGVEEALLAAYILHFHAIPDDATRAWIAALVGGPVDVALPVLGPGPARTSQAGSARPAPQ
jgi:hypothetical protein